MPDPALDVRLESPLPRSLPAGTATALFLCGQASWAGRPITRLELLVDGVPRPATAWAMPRFELEVRRSGFWGTVAVRVPDTPGAALTIGARVELPGGEHQDVSIGEVTSTPPAAAATEGRDRIAVCMATFNPDRGLLSRQLESLRAQTDTNWICVISDDASDAARYAELEQLVAGDARFVLSRSPERIGFYRNFERALTLAPADCELVALCDQDDVWHPDKLARLRAALGRATLVYSDMRLVDEAGTVLRDTLWRRRANNHTNLASMLIANTVTGAACLMRREVVERALPFPDSPGIEFHDHWLALVAMGCGELAYVDAPLYDYVQHPGAILGKVAAETRPQRRLRRLRLRTWRAAYFVGYVPGQVRAATLLLRCGDRLTPAARRTLRLYLRADRSLIGLLWLALRPLRALAGRNETLAGEWELLPGVVWFHLARRLPLDARFPDPPTFEHRRLRRWRANVSP